MPSPSGPAAGPDGVGRRVLPFWLLQAAELAVALVLVDVAAHVARGALLVVVAAVLAGAALTADGPLGVVPRCGRRLHARLVMAVSVAAAVALLLPALRPDAEGVVVTVVAAVGLVRLATLTRTDAPPDRRRPDRRRPAAVAGTGAVVVPTDPPDTPPRAAGTREGGPAPSSAHRAGRTAGAVVAGWRTAGRHRPVVEARVRRGLRGAGRLAGKFAGGAGSARSGGPTTG